MVVEITPETPTERKRGQRRCHDLSTGAVAQQSKLFPHEIDNHRQRQQEKRESVMVFIGRNLPQDIIIQGLEQCLAKAQ